MVRINKKIVIVLIVIVVGLLIGIASSLIFNNSDKQFEAQNEYKIFSSGSSSSMDIPASDTRKDDKFQLGLDVKPSSIKSTGKNADVNNLSKIDKATLYLTYDNISPTDLTNLQVSLFILGNTKSGVASSEDAKFNEELSTQTHMVFDLPYVKAHSKNVVLLYFFAESPGETKIYAEVKTGSSKPAKTNTVTVKSL